MASQGLVLKARAAYGEHYVELHVTGRKSRLTDYQRNELDQALRHLLAATAPGEVQIGDGGVTVGLGRIAVGIAELPQIDDDYHWGDPNGRLVVPGG